MVVVSYSGKEINAKLVYYGPGLSGKTTNLEFIYSSVPSNNRGKMVSMKTRTERTLFFDFLPVDLGEMGGFKTRFLLYTVPGQVYYNATRKLVLRGVDALIFVADSQRGKMDENLESLANLKDNLEEYDLKIDEIPWVIQYNKRDLEDIYTIEELEQACNPYKVPYYEASAMTGQGVFETFRGVSHLLLEKLSKEVKLGSKKGAPEVAKPSAQPAPAGPPPAPTPNAQRKTPPAPPQPRQAPAKPAGQPGATAPAPAPQIGGVARSQAQPQSQPSAQPAPPQAQPQPQPLPAPAAQQPRTPQPVPVPQPQAAAPQPIEPPIQRVEAVVETIPQFPEPPRRSFWDKLFGRGKDAPTAPPTASAELAPADLDAGEGTVVIERRVEVPITLTAEEAERGTRVRLVLELKVRESDQRRSRAA